MRRLIGALALLAIFTLGGSSPRAQPLVADLTSHLIAITTGFTGTSVVLFGATDGGGDVVVVVRGPERPMVVRRKSRVGGIWVNAQEMTFDDVPVFYSLASSRPLPEIAASVRSFYRLGVQELRFNAVGRRPPEIVAEFREALVRNMEEQGLFQTSAEKIAFLGDRLFRTTITFPANVPTGTYLVEVFLIRDNDVVSGQTTPLVVSKQGLGAEMFAFADRYALSYGLIAVAAAAMAGWLASLPFRHA